MLRNSCSDLAGDGGLWLVRLATGDRTMTLDELDAAFAADVLDVDTMVCAPDGDSFMRLGSIAGLDDAPASGVEVDFGSAPLPDAYPGPHAPILTAPLGPQRFAALSMDLGEAASLRPRWSIRRLLLVPAALAALGIIAVAASASTSSASVEAAHTLPANVRTELAATATPIAAAPTATTTAPTTPATVPTDDQKTALSAKDKKAEAAKNAKHSAAAAKHATKASSSKSSSPFSKGGNKHDPLNGAI
jgi:hypothetical protein